MIENVELWLKTSILGIILLGAVGGLLALTIARTLGRIVPLPSKLHKRIRYRQGFIHGFSARLIHDDKTGKVLQVHLALHLALIIVALFLVTLLISIFSILLAFQDRTVLTMGTFASITAAFSALYWAYLECKHIHAIYLSYWKEPMEYAREQYKKRQATKAGTEESQKEAQSTPTSSRDDD